MYQTNLRFAGRFRALSSLVTTLVAKYKFTYRWAIGTSKGINRQTDF